MTYSKLRNEKENFDAKWYNWDFNRNHSNHFNFTNDLTN